MPPPRPSCARLNVTQSSLLPAVSQSAHTNFLQTSAYRAPAPPCGAPKHITITINNGAENVPAGCCCHLQIFSKLWFPDLSFKVEILMDNQIRKAALHLYVRINGPVHLPHQFASSDLTGHPQYQQRLHATAEFCCGNIALLARPAGMDMCTKQQRTKLIRACPDCDELSQQRTCLRTVNTWMYTA